MNLSDTTNTLSNRREIKLMFKEQAGKLKRIEAAEIVAKKFGLNAKCVVPISMKNERGKRDLVAKFYAYDNEDTIKKQLPKYILLRNLSRDDRRKLADEEKATKLKAKQAAASETKGTG